MSHPKPIYGVLHPTRADRAAFANVESPKVEITCPKCGCDDYFVVAYRAPGVAADDSTCSWRECAECEHKSDPS